MINCVIRKYATKKPHFILVLFHFMLGWHFKFLIESLTVNALATATPVTIPIFRKCLLDPCSAKYEVTNLVLSMQVLFRGPVLTHMQKRVYFCFA